MEPTVLRVFVFVLPCVLLEWNRDVAHEVGRVLSLVSVALGLLVALARSWSLDNLVVFRVVQELFGLSLDRWVKIRGSHLDREFGGALLGHCSVGAGAHLHNFDLATDYLVSSPAGMGILQRFLPLGLGLVQAAWFDNLRRGLRRPERDWGLR